ELGPGRAADERRRPRQHMMDGRRALRGPGRSRDPVAHGRIAALPRLVAQVAGDLGGKFAVVGDEAVGAALLDDDASGNEVTPGEGRKVLPKLLAPAIVFDQWNGP